MRRLLFPQLALLVLFGLLLSLPAAAATYRTLIAQDPLSPTDADAVAIWMESDTVFGETAGVEYKIGTTYTKVLGTYDLSGPAPANWRAEIPAQPAGTIVEYQLFTRNESGSDYGFTGFLWSYLVDAPVPTRHTTFGAIKALYAPSR